MWLCLSCLSSFYNCTVTIRQNNRTEKPHGNQKKAKTYKLYEPSDAYLYHKVQSLPDSEVCHCKCSHTHQHCEPGAHWPFRKPRKQLDGLSERKQSLFICIWAASGSLLCRSHEATLITFACISAIAKWPRLQCTGDRHDAAFTSAASEQCVLSRGLASNPRSQIRLAWLWS